jgi:hypothetical protein
MKRHALLLAAITLAGFVSANAQPSNLNVTPTTLSVSIGARATFRVWWSGATPFSYQWWFTNALGQSPVNGVENPSALSNILNLTNVQVASAGGYCAVVTDANGLSATSRVATLDVDPTFTKITLGPLVSDGLDNYHGYWGDYDNDGRLDLLTAGNAGNWRLYHNDGSEQFSTVTQGVLGQWGSRAMWGAWADPDNDGDLDVLASPGPTMFWNAGSGDFTRVAPGGGWSTGPVTATGWYYGGAWGDFDRDGFLDCFLGLTGGGGNALLQNNGNRTFTPITAPGLTLGGDSVQVTAVVDYDNDGDLDLVLARSGGRPTQFYRNDSSGNFVEATPEPIRSELTYSLTSAWGDFDNDGYLDLAICKYGPRKKLWRNLGDGTFAEVQAGSVTAEDGNCDQTIGWVDFNEDGNLDLFVARTSGYADKLFMGNGNGDQWLEVKLRGVASDRLAVGAKIFATATIRGKVMRQMRVINASDANQTLVAHFGLGDAAQVDRLRIEWPSGIVQELQDVPANQLLPVTEHQPGGPPSPPLVAASRSAEGGLQLTVTGQADVWYVLEASTDLAQWRKAAIGRNATASVQFTPPASSSPQQFYRVVVP